MDLTLTAKTEAPFLRRNVKRRKYAPKQASHSTSLQMSVSSSTLHPKRARTNNVAESPLLFQISESLLTRPSPFLHRTLRYTIQSRRRQQHRQQQSMVATETDGTEGYLVHTIETLANGHRTMSTHQIEKFHCPLCNRYKSVSYNVVCTQVTHV